MSLILCIIAIIVLSAGIIIPRQISQKLDADKLASLEIIRNSARKYFFLSLTPLALMALLIYNNKETAHLSMYQVPAGSLIIDMFCILRVSSFIKAEKYPKKLRFALLPFITLAIAKLLLFSAFLIELEKEAARQASVFPYL